MRVVKVAELLSRKVERVNGFCARLEQVDVLQPHELKLDLDVLLLELGAVLASPPDACAAPRGVFKRLVYSSSSERVRQQLTTHSSAGAMSFVLSALRMWCSSTKHAR